MFSIIVLIDLILMIITTWQCLVTATSSNYILFLIINVLGKKNKEIRSASQQKSYDNMAKGGFKHHDDPESKYYIK